MQTCKAILRHSAAETGQSHTAESARPHLRSQPGSSARAPASRGRAAGRQRRAAAHRPARPGRANTCRQGSRCRSFDLAGCPSESVLQKGGQGNKRWAYHERSAVAMRHQPACPPRFWQIRYRLHLHGLHVKAVACPRSGRAIAALLRQGKQRAGLWSLCRSECMQAFRSAVLEAMTSCSRQQILNFATH